MLDLHTATVHELIAALAQLEDALRVTPLFEEPSNGSSALSAPVLSLLSRERDIVHELRRRRAEWRAAFAPSWWASTGMSA